jgi:hypothetical protein
MSARILSPPRPAVIALVTALWVAAAIAIAIVLTVDGDETAAQVGFNAFSFLLFGLTAAAGISTIDRPAARWVGAACVAISVAGFVVTTVLIWSSGLDAEPSEGLLKAFGSLSVCALALAQVSLLSRRPDAGGRRVVLGAQAAALLLAGMLTGAILGEAEDDGYYRWVSVAWVLWLLATALVPLSRRLLTR